MYVWLRISYAVARAAEGNLQPPYLLTAGLFQQCANIKTPLLICLKVDIKSSNIFPI